MTYANTAQLKDVLDISDTSQDGYLSELLDRVSAFIETYTGRSWSTDAQTVTDELYERQGRVLWLNAVGISNVSSVKVRDDRSDDWRTLDASSYQWTSAGRLELPLSYAYVQVSYELPASTAIPYDIESAALELAADLYRSSGEHGAVKSTRAGDLWVTYGADDSEKRGMTAMKVLDHYRMRPV